jgi:hypothetical protein
VPTAASSIASAAPPPSNIFVVLAEIAFLIFIAPSAK